MEIKTVVNLLALNAELMIMEARIDYLLNEGKKEGSIRHEIVPALKKMLNECQKLIPMIQKKFDAKHSDTNVELSHDMEYISDLFAMSPNREIRLKVIEHHTSLLEKWNEENKK